MSVNLRKTFFPLRSNAGWFQSDVLRDELEYRLKQAILFYDQIIIEDGTYEGMIWEDLTFDAYIPPAKSINRTINIETDIENTYAKILAYTEGPGPEAEPLELVVGRTIARYKIDYYDLLNELDISEYDFFELSIFADENLSKETHSIIRKQTELDLEALQNLEGSPLLKQLIIKNLNRDLILSSLLETALLTDPTNAGVLEAKSKTSFQGMQIFPDKESAIVRRFLTLKSPNFNDLSIHQVIELREDGLWQEFRENVAHISAMITDDPDILLNIQSFNKAVRDAIDEALFEEIEKREKNGVDLAIDLFLGGFSLIPGVGYAADALDAVRSLAEYRKHQRNWITFLHRIQEV